jgi:hypothetical protein
MQGRGVVKRGRLLDGGSYEPRKKDTLAGPELAWQ